MSDDKRITHIQRLRNILFDEDEKTFLDAGDIDITVSAAVDALPDSFQDLLAWWLLNRDFLLQWFVRKFIVAKCVVSGGNITETIYFNNTQFTPVFSRNGTGEYEVDLTGAGLSEFPKITFSLAPIGTAGECMTVEEVLADGIKINRFNASGTLTDGDFYIEFSYWD